MDKKKKAHDPKSDPLESSKQSSHKSKNYTAWPVFLFSVVIVLISLVSVLFPALISASLTVNIPGLVTTNADPFEPGALAVPLIITNVIVFALLALYFTKKFPETLLSIIKALFAFEISKKTAFVILVILLASYTAYSAQELAVEEIWEDYLTVKQRLESWSPEQITLSYEPHVRYFLLSSSMFLFGNFRVIPLLASIALLITTYLITKQIANKRFAGIISVVIVLQSHVFLTYDTTVSYTNFWIMFYLLSLYMIYRAWPLSPLAYLLSIPSKALTAMFLPMSIFFILRAKIPRNRKLAIVVPTVIIIAAGGALSSQIIDDTQEPFNSNEFWVGFVSFAQQLRLDGLVLLFVLPLIVGLFLAAKNGIKQAESIMVLISGILILAPILTGFTDQTNQPYRFVPLIVFFAIGVGVLLTKRD